MLGPCQRRVPLFSRQDCRLAAASLDTGEMICSPAFSLFEAMSALELMDPKMDESLLEVGRRRLGR